MSTHVVAPVQSILKSLESGSKLAKRTARSTEWASRDQALQIFESARGLQNSLERSSKAIVDAYEQSAELCGERFARALLEDRSIQNELKDLRLDLIDQLDRCRDLDDEPDSFDPQAFTSLDDGAQRCRDSCIGIFHALRDQYFQNSPLPEQREERPPSPPLVSQPVNVRRGNHTQYPYSPDDISYAPDERLSVQHAGTMYSDSVSPITPASQSVPTMPRGTWNIGSASQFDMGALATSRPPSYSFSPLSQTSTIELPPTRFSIADAKVLPLIPREVVHSRIDTNDQFLERRRKSKVLFQEEIRKSSTSPTSIYSSQSPYSMAEEHRTSGVISESSIPEHSVASSRNQSSRLSGSSSNGHDSFIGSHRGQNQSSQGTRSSATSSVLQDRQVHRPESHDPFHNKSLPASPRSEHRRSGSVENWGPPPAHRVHRQESREPVTNYEKSLQSSSVGSDSRDFGNMESWRAPSMSSAHPTEQLRSNTALDTQAPITPHGDGRTSGSVVSWGSLSSTLRIPGYGAGIESGLEVVASVDHDNEKMVVMAEDAPRFVQPPSNASMKSIDCPIAHDTSFYRFGGFCDGAKSMMLGETGFKVVKRPSGHYSATVSARCVKCSYEVGWNDVEKDRLLSRDGIYGNSGIRWRQKFISKCHVKTGSIEEPMYACIFCIEEHKTVEDHDATIFFSVSQLFRHLAKHPRPLPNVQGIATIYGQQPPEIVDFDIHFTMPNPTLPKFCMAEIATKVATRASASASGTHNPKPTGRNARDPDGQQSLRFAAGAKIVGITFPDRFNGQWCTGYHDGEKGSFPADKIILQMPVKEDVLMNSRSSLTAVAKWDFKPKDSKDGNWLKLSKGDRITCIGYSFLDQWCWSGQSSKGKWGLFPSSFVKDLKDGALIPEPRPTTSKSSSSKTGGFGSIIGIGRNKSKHERAASIRSNSSGGGGGLTAPMQGLDLVRSHAGTWQS